MIDDAKKHMADALEAHKGLGHRMELVVTMLNGLQLHRLPEAQLKNIDQTMEMISNILENYFYSDWDERDDRSYYRDEIGSSLGAARDSLRYARTLHCAEHADTLFVATGVKQYCILHRLERTFNWWSDELKVVRAPLLANAFVAARHVRNEQWGRLDVDAVPEWCAKKITPELIIDAVLNKKAIDKFTEECVKLVNLQDPKFLTVQEGFASLTPDQRALLLNRRY